VLNRQIQVKISLLGLTRTANVSEVFPNVPGEINLFSMIIFRSIHVAAHDIISFSFFFMAEYSGFPGGASTKEPACQCRRQETRVQPVDWEDSLEKGTATHSRILAWRIPWTEEPGGLQFIGHESDMTEAT